LHIIKDIVVCLLETYGTLNPFELCECLNIKVLKSNLGNEIKGFFQRTPGGYKLIHINSGIDEYEMKYICAHELGHALLHDNISLGFLAENSMQIRNKYEIQADRFAAEILVDSGINDNEFCDFNIEQISSAICVPSKLLKYKYDLG